MFSISEATDLMKKNFPNGQIQTPIEYKGLYLFQVYGPDPFEGDQDPFFSVNKETGELQGFSVLTDGDISEISKLYGF